MNILIVEDDENKGAQISSFLRTEFPSAVLTLCRSLQSGLRSVRGALPDLVLLDMTIPNYDPGPDEPGGQTHPFGGREFLRQLDRFDIILPVIIVTQFETFGKFPNAIGLEQLDAEMRSEHSRVYRGAVYYNAAVHGWKSQLRSLIQSTTGDS